MKHALISFAFAIFLCCADHPRVSKQVVYGHDFAKLIREDARALRGKSPLLSFRCKYRRYRAPHLEDGNCKEGEPIPDELPRSWSLEEIEKQTPPYGAKGPVYVLAWKVMEDDRPLRVESCLVLKALDKKEGYSLSHLYRHPADKKPEWQLSMVHVSGEKGTKYFSGLWILHSKRFKNRPGNKELYASLSLGEVGWRFEQEEGWKFVSCCVCEKNWQAVTGEAATQFFGR